MKKLRKTLPFIPILGIPLTCIFHKKYGDTGIEDLQGYGVRFTCSVIIQGASLWTLFNMI